ncbi:diacylglycerol/polyprenol kinase family protein [Rubidibacter lacunae]|uniref:diacylglycerol/polyprenol kinase family protein n=1 Tax=Rubidibacter lacunae TaxID=582514 RepID=UPI000590A5D6|nr:diacylglycerol/polyprenol kinase family protein [Rubidibacter lacunae]
MHPTILIAVVAFLAATIVLAETLSRLMPSDPELTRKIVHVGSGNVILLAWWFGIPAWIGIAASAIAGAMALLSYVVPLLPSINSVGRKSFGTFFYALSMGVLVAWFWPLDRPQFAAIGILVMAWGDGMAAIVGSRFGQHQYRVLGSTKSWEGSLAMATASFIATSLVLLSVQGTLWQTWAIALAVAALATVLEAVSQLGIDNLTVPLGSAAFSFCLSQWWLS